MTDEETRKKVEGSAGRGRRGLAGGRDWTKGNSARNLLSLSWPILIGSMLRTIGPTIDMIWVAKLGAASIAGVGIAGMAVMTMMSGRMGLNLGLRAMIARFVGAGDEEGANHVAQQALVVSAAYSIVMAAIGLLFARQILSLLGLEADVVAEGAAYMRIQFAGAAATSFHMMAEGIMQASGDAVTPMKISITYRIFHVALCPFLVFGWWIFPRMGVSGAAITGVISLILGTALGMWVIFSGRSRLRVTLRNFRIDLNIIWRIVRIGIPASVRMMQQSFSRLVLVRLMTPFGTPAVVAHTLIQRIVRLIMTVGQALGRGAGVLVGQNLGAQQPERAEKSAWLAVGFSECIMFLFSMVILFWPGIVISIFSPEPEVLEITSIFLRIAVVGYLVMSIDMVLSQCLSGAGDTLPPMIITLACTWLVTLPLAYFMSQIPSLGVYGLRWAMVIGIVARVVTYVIYFRLGRWKRKRI